MAGPVVVSNNYIHDCGLITWQAPGVRVNTNALVTQNNLFNFHTSAIADHDVDNCVFSLNSISNCMFTEEDMGAYYQYFGSYTTLAHPMANHRQATFPVRRHQLQQRICQSKLVRYPKLLPPRRLSR